MTDDIELSGTLSPAQVIEQMNRELFYRALLASISTFQAPYATGEIIVRAVAFAYFLETGTQKPA